MYHQEQEWTRADQCDPNFKGYLALDEQGDALCQHDPDYPVSNGDYDPVDLRPEGLLEGRYVAESVSSYTASVSQSLEDLLIEEEELYGPGW